MLEGVTGLGLGENPGCTKTPQKAGAGLQHRDPARTCPQRDPSVPPTALLPFPLLLQETRRQGKLGRGGDRKKRHLWVTFVSPTGCQKHLHRKNTINNPLPHPAMKIPAAPRSLFQQHPGQPQQREIKMQRQSGACENPPSPSSQKMLGLAHRNQERLFGGLEGAATRGPASGVVLSFTHLHIRWGIEAEEQKNQPGHHLGWLNVFFPLLVIFLLS